MILRNSQKQRYQYMFLSYNRSQTCEMVEFGLGLLRKLYFSESGTMSYIDGIGSKLRTPCS